MNGGLGGTLVDIIPPPWVASVDNRNCLNSETVDRCKKAREEILHKKKILGPQDPVV